MKLASDSFEHRRAMPTCTAFGRHRFYPRELEAHERFELSDNQSPHLRWSEVPEGTRSFALICTDPDAPADAALANQVGATVPRDAERADFAHWVLVDIPADCREIAAGSAADGVVARGKDADGASLGRHGLNDYTQWFKDDADMAGDYFGYDGPCPPWNDELIHMYTFRVLALDTDRVAVDGRFTTADVQRAVEGHVLAEAELQGFYFINPDARFR